MGTDVTEETVDGAQTHIPRAGLVVSTRFQTLQKSLDLLASQLLHGQLTGVALLSRHKQQEELEAITVTMQRVGTQRPLSWQVVCEKAV